MPRHVAVPRGPAPKALVSSAARIPTANPRHRTRSRSEKWQALAWQHYDICGELRYGANWFANALSRSRIYVARRRSDGSLEPIETGRPKEALDELFSDSESQATMLKAMGPHYFIGGEWYFVGRPDPDAPDLDIWEVVSPNEMKIIAGNWVIDYGDGTKIELDDDAFVARLWNPHPRYRSEPDSPVRAVLPVLEEMRLLTAHISAQVRSRLAGAGILFLPSEMSFSAAPNQEGMGNEESDEFIATLYDAMNASISDPSDPSALVPIVVQAEGEHLDKANHMTFWSSLDENASGQREQAMRRLALGLDLPPEVLTGTGDVNHWGMWAIDESSIKSHIEPALEVICAGLTKSYLRNIDGIPSDVVFAWDTSALRLRPNRSKEALELYDRGELKGESLLRETGFDSTDAPDDKERNAWLLRKVASGSATPEQVEAALNMMGVHLHTSGEGQTRESRPSPSLREHPEQAPPEQSDDQDETARAALLAACDVLCMRALERAGNRIKGKFKVNPPNIPAHDLYRFVQAAPDHHSELLSDVWSTLDRAIEGYGVSPGLVEQALDAYCRNLLISQGEHTKSAMAKFLHQVPGL